jgi:hypothetical protein
MRRTSVCVAVPLGGALFEISHSYSYFADPRRATYLLTALTFSSFRTSARVALRVRPCSVYSYGPVTKSNPFLNY